MALGDLAPEFISTDTVSEPMLRAGRSAFEAGRDKLDDLYGFFDPDLDELLCGIYRAMAAAA